jgi:hypothetical protein
VGNARSKNARACGKFKARVREKENPTQKASLFLLQGNNVEEAHGVQWPLLVKAGQKSSKRNLKNEISPSSQQPERSNSDSLPDSSTSGSEYRVLRRKYLLLEEESFALGGELREIEDEVKTLEEEKLVVLEGLLDPSELH